VAQAPVEVPEKTMLISIDIAKDRLDKTKEVVSMCSTIDNKFTKYYSKVDF
jgi:hypothetical protein